MAQGLPRFLPWILAAALPACAVWLTPALPGTPFWMWAAVGAALGAALLLFRPQLPTGVLIGAALLGVSGYLGQKASPELARLSGAADVPFYDLTQGPLPDDAAGRVRVRGHLLAEPKLDEYAVEKGGMPDQNSPPLAVVRLFLPTAEFAIPSEGRYLAARVLVAQGSERQNGADVVEGTLRPLPPELIEPIFGGQSPPPESREGWLLDAGDQVSAQDVYLDVALAFVAALLALMSWRSAFGREDETKTATESAETKS